MSKKLVTLEQLLESDRVAMAQNAGFAEEVAEELAKRPTEEEVAAKLPVRRNVTLTATDWAGDGPYTQTVAVAGVRADEAGQLVQPVPASDSLDAWDAAGVKCTGQGAGTLEFIAQEKPPGNISAFVILQEVGS